MSEPGISVGTVGASSSAASLPAAIYIIRHGEKPPDASDTADTPDPSSEPPFGVDLDGNQNPDSLIPQGWQRAGALAGFFDPSDGVFGSSLLAKPTTLGVPKYGNPPQHRTYQTVWPLAQKLGLEPTITVDVGQESDLAGWVLAQSGQTVLVCWEHKHIDDLIGDLGKVVSGGEIPGPWPGDRFDLVVALTPDPADPGTYVCTQIPQLLLAGDSIDPIRPG